MLTLIYVEVNRQYKGNAFLFVLDNNGYEEAPQNYVARALPTFLEIRISVPCKCKFRPITSPEGPEKE
jgi:hypothetical protein